MKVEKAYSLRAPAPAVVSLCRGAHSILKSVISLDFIQVAIHGFNEPYEFDRFLKLKHPFFYGSPFFLMHNEVPCSVQIKHVLL